MSGNKQVCGNDQISSKMKEAFAKKPGFKARQAPPLSDSDGVTHINIDNIGKTELGRFLAAYSEAHFKHPKLGPFISVQGFTDWYRSEERPDQLRRLFGSKAKSYARQNCTLRRNVPNFKREVILANWYKVICNPKFATLMWESTLPFFQYYLYGPDKIEIRMDENSWLIEGFEKIRLFLKIHGPNTTEEFDPSMSLKELQLELDIKKATSRDEKLLEEEEVKPAAAEVAALFQVQVAAEQAVDVAPMEPAVEAITPDEAVAMAVVEAEEVACQGCSTCTCADSTAIQLISGEQSVRVDAPTQADVKVFEEGIASTPTGLNTESTNVQL